MTDPSEPSGVAARSANFAILGIALCACVAEHQTSKPGPPRALDPIPVESRISRITSDLLPNAMLRGVEPERRSLEERMRSMHVPGVSIAVADHGRIAWVRSYGVADTELNTSVTAQTLFETGSIWKAINATIALRLVDRRELGLDTNVNDYLRTWKVPDNDYTREEKVTLRRLLSHTAGFNSTDYVGEKTEANAATLVDLLEGRFSAGGRRARVEHVPGSEVHYSNGGALVAQLVLQDATGEPLDQLAKQYVFDPLGMADTTYRRPLPSSWESRTAAAHDAAGRRYAGRYTEPLPLTHLWTTPSDLLRWAIGVAAAYEGRTDFLSQDAARQMLTPVLKGQPFALGTFVWGAGDDLSFYHGGRTEGAAAEVKYNPARGQGAAVMINGDAGAYLSSSLLRAIGREYGWSGSEPQQVDFEATSPDVLREAIGTYIAQYPLRAELRLSSADGSLIVECFKLAIRSRAVPMGQDQFVTLEEALPVMLKRNGDGRTRSVDVGGWVFTRLDDKMNAAQLGR